MSTKKNRTKEQKLIDKWEKAKKHKPGCGTLVLLLLCPFTLGIPLIILLILSIVWLYRYFVFKRMKDLPEVQEHEKFLREKEEKERERERSKIAEEDKRKKELDDTRAQRHAKNELIVCASARVNGHYDDNGTRQVYVDGRPFAEARPWAVIGLQPGYHSVYVVYTESVGGSIYRGQTDTVTICADEESAVLFATRNSLRIAPVQTFGISSIDEVIRLAKQEGASSPTF